MYPTNAFFAFLSNRVIWIPFVACVSAQVLKVLITYAYSKKVNTELFLSTGGMPSSHSALVVSLSATIGAVEGLHTPIFALSMAFAVIVMHDAQGVRRAAGKHAEVINMLMEHLESNNIKLDKKLKELLGHSPLEVIAGAIWGILVAMVAHNFF